MVEIICRGGDHQNVQGIKTCILIGAVKSKQNLAIITSIRRFSWSKAPIDYTGSLVLWVNIE